MLHLLLECGFQSWILSTVSNWFLINLGVYLVVVSSAIAVTSILAKNAFNALKTVFGFVGERVVQRSTIPEKPNFIENLCICIGEVHDPITGKRVENPSLVTIPEKGLYTNLFVFGSIGSGKTVFLLSALEQLLSYKKYDPELRPCGLFIDEKGNLGSQVLDIAKRIGREDDIYLFDLSGRIIWNPIHDTTKGADIIARRLEKIMETTVEKSADWIRKYAYEFLVNSIKLIRFSSPDYYVTMKEISEHIYSEDKIIQKLQYIKENKKAIALTLATIDTDLKNLDCLEYLQKEEAMLRMYFEQSWFHLKKNNAEVFGYISTALSQLISPFLDPKISHIFNPESPETINFKGFDWMINEGKLFVYSVPDSIYEGLGKFISLFLKLPFQKTCLSRIPKTTIGTEVYDPKYNAKRSILFVADENQNSYHSSDNEALDKLREAKVIHICLTQTYVSLLARNYPESTILQYLGSFRSKLFLSCDDARSSKYYSELLGQDHKSNTSVSYSESSKNANINILQNEVENTETNLSKSVNISKRLENRYDYTKFLDLRMFQGIFYGFTGKDKIQPLYVYVKPYWVDWSKDYFSYIEEI